MKIVQRGKNRNYSKCDTEIGHECEWNMEKPIRIVHYSAGADNRPCNDKLLSTGV